MSRHQLNQRTVEHLFFDQVVDKPSGTDTLELIRDRYRGLIEVLLCIPPEEYESIKALMLECLVLMPSHSSRASVFGFTRALPKLNGSKSIAAYMPILYLAPSLEGRSPAFVRGAVAYALAEFLVGDGFLSSFEQKKAVYERICKWGFRDEAEMVLNREFWEPQLKAKFKALLRSIK